MGMHCCDKTLSMQGCFSQCGKCEIRPRVSRQDGRIACACLRYASECATLGRLSDNVGRGRGQRLACMFVCSLACSSVPTARRHAHIHLRLRVGALRQQGPNHLRVAIVRRSVERRPFILQHTQASRSAPASAVPPTPSGSVLPAPARSEHQSRRH